MTIRLHPSLKQLANHVDFEIHNNHLCFTLDEDETNHAYELPLKVELCDNCNGFGKHLRDSLRSIAFSTEDEDYDPDFMEEMREGRFDQPCNTCGGQGRVLSLVATPDVVKQIIENAEESYREDRQTMYMESGGMYGSRN